jgi:hypothetical protein
MKQFQCCCGTNVFFDSSICVSCGSQLGYDPVAGEVLALTPHTEDTFTATISSGETKIYKCCRNHVGYSVCNWLVEVDDFHERCIACRLNRIIPNLTRPKNLARWKSLEQAKHRLVYTLLALGLPVVSQWDDPDNGLLFDFLEDTQEDMEINEGFNLTGHSSGVITINVLEADDVLRESMRTEMNESYRTLLGHFRHESGHYYWPMLFDENQEAYREFHDLFGSEKTDYQKALSQYYSSGAQTDWWKVYISAYASSHPMEDWAETWAHYLHMTDTLETAVSQQVIEEPGESFDSRLSQWVELAVKLNQLNRSMGLPDAYPFVIPKKAREKLAFIHRLLNGNSNE